MATETSRERGTEVQRRQVLAGLAAMPLLAAPGIVRATPSGRVGAHRLWAIRLYDGEQLDAPIRLRSEEGTRNARMLWSHYWRDVKDDDRAVWVEHALLDRLSGLQVAVSERQGEETPLILVSGYRTPERNATIEGAAVHSQHCVGTAADFRFRGVASSTVANMIDNNRVWGNGGLGRYANFTHLDTARRRRWWG